MCGIRIHFGKPVSHQCVLNEICLHGFSILLTVIILVNTGAFNKGALPLPDSSNNKRVLSSLSEHTASMLCKWNISFSLYEGHCFSNAYVRIFHVDLYWTVYCIKAKKESKHVFNL